MKVAKPKQFTRDADRKTAIGLATFGETKIGFTLELVPKLVWESTCPGMTLGPRVSPAIKLSNFEKDTFAMIHPKIRGVHLVSWD